MNFFATVVAVALLIELLIYCTFIFYVFWGIYRAYADILLKIIAYVLILSWIKNVNDNNKNLGLITLKLGNYYIKNLGSLYEAFVYAFDPLLNKWVNELIYSIKFHLFYN